MFYAQARTQAPGWDRVGLTPSAIDQLHGLGWLPPWWIGILTTSFIGLVAMRCIWLNTWRALRSWPVHCEHKILSYYYCCYRCQLVLLKECPNPTPTSIVWVFISTHVCQYWVLSFLIISLFANLIGFNFTALITSDKHFWCLYSLVNFLFMLFFSLSLLLRYKTWYGFL